MEEWRKTPATTPLSTSWPVRLSLGWVTAGGPDCCSLLEVKYLKEEC